MKLKKAALCTAIGDAASSAAETAGGVAEEVGSINGNFQFILLLRQLNELYQ